MRFRKLDYYPYHGDKPDSRMIAHAATASQIRCWRMLRTIFLCQISIQLQIIQMLRIGWKATSQANIMAWQCFP